MARSRVERIDQRLTSIQEAMAQASQHIEGMETDLKNAHWSLDRLRTEAAGHPIVGDLDQALAAMAATIVNYATGQSSAPAPAPASAAASAPAAPAPVATPPPAQFAASAPVSVDLITGQIPRYGLVFAWDRSTPMVQYYLLALNAWQGSVDVGAALRGELDGIQVYPFPGDAVHVVDNATPPDQRRYFALVGQQDGSVVKVRGLSVIARAEMHDGAVYNTPTMPSCAATRPATIWTSSGWIMAATSRCSRRPF